MRRVPERGAVPAPKRPGRKACRPDQARVEAVLCAFHEYPEGADGITGRLKPVCDISYHDVRRIMKAEGLPGSPGRRSRKPFWLRYGRRYSNAM